MRLFKADRPDGLLSKREMYALVFAIVCAAVPVAMGLEGRPMLLLPWEEGYFDQ